MSSRGRTNNGTEQHIDPQLPILDVAPLNSVPYFGPPISRSNVAPSQPEMEAEAVESIGPSIMYFPSHSTEEWDKLLAATKSGIGLVGSAAMGNMGPVVGAVDIGECEDSYLFRVSLPGVSRDEKDFRCDVEPDGKIFIKGVTTTGEKTVVKNSQIFKMTQNLCPPGHFSISFQLPDKFCHKCIVQWTKAVASKHSEAPSSLLCPLSKFWKSRKYLKSNPWLYSWLKGQIQALMQMNSATNALCSGLKRLLASSLKLQVPYYVP